MAAVISGPGLGAEMEPTKAAATPAWAEPARFKRIEHTPVKIDPFAQKTAFPDPTRKQT